jgi:hypothetical protein
MKRLLASLLALCASVAFGATELPVQLLNPTGSTSGQAVVSTGPTSAPGWGVPSACSGCALLSGATFTGAVSVSYSNAALTLNDTSGSNQTNLNFQSNGSNRWSWGNPSSSSTFQLSRYVSGTYTDSPISVSNSTGAITLTDGLSGVLSITNAATSGSTIIVNATSNTSTGAAIELEGNGSTTPNKYLQVFNGSFRILNNAGSGATITVDDGGDLTTGGSITPSQTAGIVGTTTNNAPSAGSVGEIIQSTVTGGSAVSISSTVPANVTSISLTAGDWDVCGETVTLPAGTTTQAAFATAISLTSATIPALTANATYVNLPYAVAAGISIGSSAGCVTERFASTTPVYLVVQSNFAVSTNAAFGWIYGRRRR